MYIKKIIIALVFIAVSLLITQYQTETPLQEVEPAPQIQKSDIDTMTYQQMVDYIAPQFNQNPIYVKQIIWNESNFKIQSHDGGRAKNITAIHNSTFKGWLKEYETERGETLDINSQFDQIKMMSFAFEKGYASQWTTHVACQNQSKTYTFVSKTLGGKQFTVTCKSLPKEYI